LITLFIKRSLLIPDFFLQLIIIFEKLKSGSSCSVARLAIIGLPRQKLNKKGMGCWYGVLEKLCDRVKQ